MPVPTHDITCTTKAYRTNCPSCTEEVWSFSCSCGSKVSFDFLGHPWDAHECREFRIRRELSIIQNAHLMTSDEIYILLMKHSQRSGQDIDPKVMEIIEVEIGRRKSPLAVKETFPDINERLDEEVVGEVLDLNNEVNIYKKLGYNPESAIDEKLLRSKIKELKWARAVIRTNPDKFNRSNQYELLFTQAYLKNNPIRKGQTLLGVARPRIHVKGVFWELIKHDLY